jgi:hypothetical protein
MAKPLQLNVDHSRTPVYSVLAGTGSPVAAILKRVERTVKRPLDSACLLLALEEISTSVKAAMGLLPDQTEIAEKLLCDLDSLHVACEKEYKLRGISDSFATLERQLTRYRGWATLAFLAEIKAPIDGGRVAALGMEIALKLIATSGNPRVADAHMRDLASGRPNLDITALEMLQQIYHHPLDDEDLPKWFKRAESTYHRFCKAFQKSPPPPPPAPTFEQIATARWRALIAHPSYRQRAAILDRTCLSLYQIDKVFNGHAKTTLHPDVLETVLWISGFSGLSFQWLKSIPLADPSLVNWRAYLDLNGGIFWRDFTALAPDSARAIPESHAIPASYLAPLPMPKDVQKFLCSRLAIYPAARNLGDLMPELLSIASTHAIYTTGGDLQPTWARWVRTTGGYLRQSGLESLLTSILTGNFGHCAKSKLYYCAVEPQEIWKASARAYKILRFGPPSAMPTGLLCFGSSVVPTRDSVREHDLDMIAIMEVLRVKGKADLEKVVDFHNAYVRAIGLRFACLLGLRKSAAFAILASIDETTDDVVDIDDKTTGDKPGALPVLLCGHLKQLIALYRKHCLAFSARLKGRTDCSHICMWLDDVVNSMDVPLLCTISEKGHPVPLGTSDIIGTTSTLADDFGRKVIENWTRQHNALTRDTDRMLRHEVLGQGSNNSASDHSESDWVQRMLPLIDILAAELFPTTIFGLRSQ